MIERIAILGTGLIGSSVGLALRSHGFAGSITGWDPNPGQVHIALRREAITVIADDPLSAATEANLILLGGPVFTILEWLDRLAPILQSDQLVTDVGSVKGALCEHARGKYNGPGQPVFLPGHPMAGKEVSGAENADPGLFEEAVWLFTPWSQPEGGLPSEEVWRAWVTRFGARIVDLDPIRHDVLCAWISHLPQFVSTAMCALLEDEFAANADLLPIGGRSLDALEQRIAHIRENLKTPELRDEFDRANRFRLRDPRNP
jgi:prephenate dehydrogenase